MKEYLSFYYAVNLKFEISSFSCIRKKVQRLKIIRVIAHVNHRTSPRKVVTYRTTGCGESSDREIPILRKGTQCHAIFYPGENKNKIGVDEIYLLEIDLSVRAERNPVIGSNSRHMCAKLVGSRNYFTGIDSIHQTRLARKKTHRIMEKSSTGVFLIYSKSARLC